ncbi:MAG: hypothetical protein KDK36_20110, partial [Leptospiraceae bacterium]|nr:hypothetical protein [Leptospiraceae bacterium]
RLKNKLLPYEVYHVKEMGWSSIKNGELLKKAVDNQFKVFITADKNLIYQQNIAVIELSIFVLKVFRLKFSFIEPLIPGILKQLKEINDNKIYEIE